MPCAAGANVNLLSGETLKCIFTAGDATDLGANPKILVTGFSLASTSNFVIYLTGITNPATVGQEVEFKVNAFAGTNFAGTQQLKRAYIISANTGVSTATSGDLEPDRGYYRTSVKHKVTNPITAAISPLVLIELDDAIPDHCYATTGSS